MATKTPTKRERAINYFIDNFKATPEEFLKYIIFQYYKNTVPVVAIFAPRGAKTEYHYRFNTKEEADNFVIKQKAYITKQHENEQNRLKQYEEEKKGFEAGKILVSSWGCEQTNVDFYLIIERKKDFLILQEIGEKRIYGGHDDRGTTIPDLTNRKGQPFRKKISVYASVKLESYKYCRLWDGKPEYFSSYA